MHAISIPKINDEGIILIEESVHYVIFNDRLEQREIVKVLLYDLSFDPPPPPRIYIQIKAAYFISGLSSETI